MIARLRWVPVLGLLAVLAAAPAMAHATLAFVRGPLSPQVWVANDNGKAPHELVAGSLPRVSPDGKIVALLRQGAGRKAQPELVLAPADGSAPASTLVSGWREPFIFAWSPDSKSVAVLLGPEVGSKRLVLIDTVTGARQTVAQGYFNGVSFDPVGGALVYARAGSEKYPPSSDVYRFDIPLGESVRFEPPVRLTHDRRSTNPLWGPNGKIVFVKLLGAKNRKYGPKNELYLMNDGGGQIRRLTHTTVDPLAQGLYPTQWSTGGSRLLAEFGGQDLSYAVAVNPRTGSQRPLVKATERGFVGASLSADGKLVLGSTGGGEPGPGHDVATVPYGGGKPKVLAKNAFEPSWGG